jgi:RHS repeat-associated protein
LRYNAIGQLISITNPLGQREQYQYDTRGNLLRYTDALGRGHQFEYDLLDRLQAHIDPLQARTEYHYDAAGRLTQLIAANGASVRYEYDGQGRLAAYTHFDGQTETYSYHPDNTLARWQHPSGARREFAYDAAKRVIRMVTNNDEYVYGYNRRDQRVLARNAAGAIEWAYDTRGRLQREQAQGFATEFGYDDEDRLVTENLLGELRRYSYDNRGLPARIQTPAGDVTLRHDARGRLSERQLPNGLVLRYEYDAAGRLTQLSHGGLAQYHYGYDATGQIIQWTGDGAPRRYQYDAAGRLTQVLGGVTETFVYDRMGNRMNAGARFDAANRLLEDDEYRYDYDARGNRSLRESRHSGVREVYRYNALNQLVSYEVYPSPQGPEPQRSTRYGYDAMGRRWVKEDSLAGRSEYLWVGAGLAAEHRAGTIVRLYGGEYQRLGLDYHWAHEDHLGTLQMLSDGAGRLAWSGEHLAYGGLRSQTGEVEQPLRFPGQYADAESGLHQNYFRDYDPQRGIYLQSDPIGLAGGLNTYLYANANPLHLIDPLGLYTEIIIWQPYGWTGSSLGHVSGNINGQNFSWAPDGWDSRPMAITYIERQRQFRSGAGVILNLTPGQEAKLANCLSRSGGEYDAVTDNCGTPFKDCLASIGLDIGYPLFPVDIGDALLNSPLYGGSTFYLGPKRGFFDNILRGDFPDAPWAR